MLFDSGPGAVDGRIPASARRPEEHRCPGAGRDQGPVPQPGPHRPNAVAVDGSWRTPGRVGAHEAPAVVLDRPGVYRFYCTFHATRDGRRASGTTRRVPGW